MLAAWPTHCGGSAASTRRAGVHDVHQPVRQLRRPRPAATRAQRPALVDQAITDLTAALDLDPTLAWALCSRGLAHRQTGHYDQARQDLEHAVEADPGHRGYAFEKLMLDTVESGIGACVEQWSQLLASPVSTPEGDATRFFDLFRVLLLEPENSVAEATGLLLAGDPDHDAVTDLLHYLAELSALGDEQPRAAVPPAHRRARLRMIRRTMRCAAYPGSVVVPGCVAVHTAGTGAASRRSRRS